MKVIHFGLIICLSLKSLALTEAFPFPGPSRRVIYGSSRRPGLSVRLFVHEGDRAWFWRTGRGELCQSNGDWTSSGVALEWGESRRIPPGLFMSRRVRSLKKRLPENQGARRKTRRNQISDPAQTSLFPQGQASHEKEPGSQQYPGGGLGGGGYRSRSGKLARI